MCILESFNAPIWWLDLTLRSNSSYTCSMGFMTWDEAGQGKSLTLFYHEIMWLFATSNIGCRLKWLRGWINVLTRRHTCATRSCTNSDIPSFVVPVHKIMNSLSRAAKMMRDAIYRRPRHDHANNLVSLISWKMCRHLMEVFCNN